VNAAVSQHISCCRSRNSAFHRFHHVSVCTFFLSSDTSDKLRCAAVTQQGSFRGETRGNAVPVVKVFRNAKNALDFKIFAYTVSKLFLGGNTPEPLQKRPRCLDPDTNFRLARQRSHCSSFTKRLLSRSSTHREVESQTSEFQKFTQRNLINE